MVPEFCSIGLESLAAYSQPDWTTVREPRWASVPRALVCSAPRISAMTQERWSRISEWPLTIAAVLFLTCYAWEVIGALTGPSAAMTEAVMAVTWVIFFADYIANLVLAPRRWRWFRTHLLDLAIVVLPILRPLRLLRLVTLLSMLQRTAGTAFRERVVLYVAGASVLLVFVSALAVLDANAQPLARRSRRSGTHSGGRLSPSPRSGTATSVR
jgi:small-conductance mechanosensitive channel